MLTKCMGDATQFPEVMDVFADYLFKALPRFSTFVLTEGTDGVTAIYAGSVIAMASSSRRERVLNIPAFTMHEDLPAIKPIARSHP